MKKSRKSYELDYKRQIVGIRDTIEAIQTEHLCAGYRTVQVYLRGCCIHHSDRGVQYLSHAYVDLLKENGLQISNSAQGNPYHKARVER